MWLSLMVHKCKMIISPGAFLNFLKIFIFRVVKGVNRKEMVQNDKKFCPLRSICQEPYIIWLSFFVHMRKMVISPGFFFIFLKCWFLRLLGEGGGRGAGLKGKKPSEMTKNSVSCSPYLRSNTSYDCHLWYTFVKW